MKSFDRQIPTHKASNGGFIKHNNVWNLFVFNMGVSENVVYPIVPNGFADQTIPMKNG